ncbi:Uncharacterised protein [Staphylococcus aureus]|nr:Uncharacterised protein [Staphylococcus aureus]
MAFLLLHNYTDFINKNSMRIFFEEIYVELLQFNGNIDIFSLYINYKINM